MILSSSSTALSNSKIRHLPRACFPKLKRRMQILKGKIESKKCRNRKYIHLLSNHYNLEVSQWNLNNSKQKFTNKTPTKKALIIHFIVLQSKILRKNRLYIFNNLMFHKLIKYKKPRNLSKKKIFLYKKLLKQVKLKSILT